MEKYTYKLKILSSVIVSPRGNLAWYIEDGNANREEKRRGEPILV